MAGSLVAEHARLVDPRHRVRSLTTGGRWESPVGAVIGIALIACGALSLLAAIAAMITDQREVLLFLALGVAWSVLGVGLAHQCRIPRRMRSSTAFVGVFAVWLTVIAVSTVTYGFLGTFGHWDESLFESVAGFTTTASSVLADPDSAARGTLIWRAGTQWLGGLGALLFVVAILPSIGVGGLDETEAGHRYSGTSLRSRRTLQQLRRLAGLYSGLTMVGMALFLVGGMGPFDAVTYAATTISTGGFSNHRGSFGHFDSTVVEWAGIGGMALGGLNLALLFRVASGRSVRTFWRSYELRAYLGVLVVGSAVVAWTTRGDTDLGHETIRNALFHVTSAASTTGHFIDGWGMWDIGPQALLVAIMGMGAMSGSAGSGFRLVRVMALGAFLRREMILQLHPRAVTPIRVGEKQVNEALVGRMIGYQAQYLLVGAVGALAIATLGPDLLTAGTAAISSIANVGPALGTLAPGVGTVIDLPRPARAAMMPLMLLGRLEIAPVLVGAALALSSVTGRFDAAAHRMHAWRRR